MMSRDEPANSEEQISIQAELLAALKLAQEMLRMKGSRVQKIDRAISRAECTDHYVR